MDSAVPPQIIAGKYELVRLLGKGGMGAVYEGRNIATFKRCAVKLLLTPELADNKQIVKRFFIEARASSVIESDYVVEIFDSGLDPVTNYPYMVMELLNGEDLEHAIEREGALEPMVAAKLMLQVCTGLAKAHAKGIFHRDIKSANLFLLHRESGDLQVKVLDFGIAKVKIESFHETSGALTKTGSILGTPLYMSPEQTQGASGIDARSDVWSLGAVLFEMLCGRTPFADASSLGDLMLKIFTADLPLVQDFAPWVPPALAEITHTAMSRDLSRRYTSAAELREALAQVVTGSMALTPAMITRVSAEQRAYRAPRLTLTNDGMLRAANTRTGLATTQDPPPRRSRAVPGVVGAAVALGLAGSAVFVMRHHAAPPLPALSATPEKPALTPPPEPPPPLSPAADVKHYALSVPREATITVDGTAVENTGGKIMLSGIPGAVLQVLVIRGTQHMQQAVAVTSNGLVPDQLELKADAHHGAAVTGASTGKKTKDNAAAAPSPETAAAAKPVAKQTGIDDNTNEFK